MKMMIDRHSFRFINGRIYHEPGDRAPANTLVTLGGVIHFIGSKSEAPRTETTIDLRGAVMMPGLTDAHFHLFVLATERLQIPLDPRSVKSPPALLDCVSSAARLIPQGRWIRCVGFDENGVPELRYPTREELDVAAPDHPVFIHKFCGHTAVLSSAALRGLEIEEGVSDPIGGSFCRDSAGRLNGIAKELAADAAFRKLPQVERETVAKSLKATIGDAMRLRLTAAVEAAVGFTSGFDEEYGTWELLKSDRSLPRLGLMYRLDPKDALALSLMPRRNPDRQTNSLKFFADGIAGARTAAVSADYHDVKGTGLFMRDEDELGQVIVEAHLAGWQVAVHSVGDRAISKVIGAFEKAQRAMARADARHRIEHYTCPPAGGLVRMKKVGAIVVSQPNSLSVMHRSTIDVFGPLAETRYPARLVLEAGVPYVASSDAPTGDFSPWVGMAEAIERGASKGRSIGASEGLLRIQAIRSYVRGGAYEMRQEHWRGVLEVGRAAELIVVDCDPFESSVDVRRVEVLVTMVRGSVEHDVIGSQSPATARTLH